jgi:hypothetical protein
MQAPDGVDGLVLYLRPGLARLGDRATYLRSR